jgi:3',5'-nucleoside bisphosphate phosphatase
MGEWLPVDLHVHSALSPCASDDMRPPAVLLSAEERGIALLGIVDHSAAGNATAFHEAAEAFDVEVLVGLEIESAEGVHVVTLFDSPDQAHAMAERLNPHLLPIPNRPDIFGNQLLLDAMGDLAGEEPRLLAGAADLSIEEILTLGQSLHGLCYPAHVDRTANGLLALLGFVPPGLPSELLEVSPNTTRARARERWPELAQWPLVTGSDAHCLPDIGRAVTLVPAALVRERIPAHDWGALLREALAEGGG